MRLLAGILLVFFFLAKGFLLPQTAIAAGASPLAYQQEQQHKALCISSAEKAVSPIEVRESSCRPGNQSSRILYLHLHYLSFSAILKDLHSNVYIIAASPAADHTFPLYIIFRSLII